MDEKQFEALIERYLLGVATEEESRQIEKWLEHRTKRDVVGKLSPIEMKNIRDRNFESLSVKVRTEGRAPMKSKPTEKSIAFYRAAAAILLLSVLSISVFKFTESVSPEKIAIIKSASADGMVKKVILGDSSIVWLKGNSSIAYPERFEGRNRTVELSGEALFEVAKDPDHPFMIECGGLTAQVLGTSFNISSSVSQIEVFVLTGKVALSSKGNAKGLILHPNEKAVYLEAENEMAKVITKVDERTAKIIGTQYSMRFKATPMKEIIKRIEDKFDVQLVLSDERLNNCTITADFTDQSLDRTLNMIAQTLGISYEINENTATLSGEGCD